MTTTEPAEVSSASPDNHPCVLVATTDKDLVAALLPLLETRHCLVMTCGTTHEAMQLVNTNNIAAVLLDLVLAGQDSRRLVFDLRSRPTTAALPIVVMGPLAARQRSGLVRGADLYFDKPVDPVEVADGVAQHLARGQERVRQACRDVITGLPNRAAFCEEYKQTAKNCAANREPLALAILGIQRIEILAKECGESALNSLIERIATTISMTLRTTDTIARWSQSEFAILLPGEDHNGATHALKKVMSALSRLTLTGTDGGERPAALCVGLAIVNDGATLNEAVAEAEKQLYESFAASRGIGNHQGVESYASPTSPRPELIAICMTDARMGRAISQILAKDRFTIRLFTTTDELLAGLAETRYHLLIADDDLPTSPEGHLLERIRTIPKCSILRVIMLVSGESGIVRTMELGASDYAVKPPDIASFISRIRRLLSGNEPFSQVRTVMIVDHEIPQLLVAGTTLHRRCGCTVLLAHGTEDALLRLATQTPEILILDFDLPETDLRNFISRIPANHAFDIIPSATLSSKMIELDSGAFRFPGRLTRPYKPDNLFKEFCGVLSLPEDPPSLDAAHMDAIDIEIRRILTRRR